MKKYFNYTVKKALTVNNLVTLEYLDLSPSFTYPEEVHGFYEFAYVDNGSLICNDSGKEVILKQGDFYLIPPNVNHFYSLRKNQSASIFIVCFNSKSDIIDVIKGRSALDKHEKQLISKILSESQKAFKFPFDKKLALVEKPVFGAGQLIENTIEEVLISLIRLKLNENSGIKIVMNSIELENNLIQDIINTLKSALYGNVTLEQISKKIFYSKTYLNKIFNKNVGCSIMHYYALMKVEESKTLLKRGATVSEIADKLCFDSPNYFSKVFKKHVKKTPTEFKQSIK